MKAIIRDLLCKTQSNDFQKSNSAVTDLAFLLEMNSSNLDYEEKIFRYEPYLSETLRAIELDFDERKAIVDFMKTSILNRSKHSSSMFWAISKSRVELGLEPLLEIIEKSSINFTCTELYQLIRALDSLILFREPSSIDKEVRDRIKKANLLQYMQDLIRDKFADIDLSKLELEARELLETAQAFIENLLRFLNNVD
jgi:hypothetical protein